MSSISVLPQHAGVPSPPDFDLFVVHAESDRAWVEGYLKPMLGLDPARVFAPRDFRLGAVVAAEFERGVTSSRYTLLVLSPAFLADRWAEFGEGLVSFSAVDEGRNRLLALTLHPCQAPLRLRFRESLDCTDSTQWDDEAARLRRHLDAPEPTVEAAACPYPGMVPFRKADARFFHGRDDEIQKLLTLIRHNRFLIAIGSSGSGKSSLITAGLLPKLDDPKHFPSGTWRVLTMRPGATPIEELDRTFGNPVDDPVSVITETLAVEPVVQRLLLVVDQFEELFSQVKDGPTRDTFLARLKALRDDPRCNVVLTMRADFYGDLMNSALWPIDRSQIVEVAALRGEALRQAIVKPSGAVGVYLEEGLVERLLADAANEPGALPMLQEALVLLWGTMAGRLLTRASYDALGQDCRSGLAVAMATKADATVAALPADHQRIARRIFLRLIQFGEGRPDTRRQLGVPDLRSENDPPAAFDAVLQQLIANRLVTSSIDERRGQRLDISHEMLIVGWPASRDWVESRRQTEKVRRRLAVSAAEWVRLGCGGAGLLDAVELAEAEGWINNPDAADLGIDPDVRSLVGASRAEIERAAAEKEVARQRELMAAQDLARERGQRIKVFHVAVGVTSALALIAIVLGAFALVERKTALRKATAALKAEAGEKAQRVVAEGETKKALAATNMAERRYRETQALLLATRAIEGTEYAPQRRLLLAAEAVRATWDAREPAVAAAEEALRKTLAPFRGRVLSGHRGPILDLAVSPKGLVATASYDGTVWIWDLAPTADTPLRGVLPGDKRFRPIAFDPDGRLAVGGGDGAVKVWHPERLDPNAPVPPPAAVLKGPARAVQYLAFTHDGRLAVAYEGGPVRVWAKPEDALPSSMELPQGDREIRAFAMSPDGRLATADKDNRILAWDLRHGSAPVPVVVEACYDRGVLNGGLNLLRFGTNGRLAASGTQSGWKLWNLDALGAAGSALSSADPGRSVEVLRFSDTGLVAVVGPSFAQIWDVRRSEPTALEPRFAYDARTDINTSTVAGADLLPDDRLAVTAAGLVHVWRLGARKINDRREDHLILAGHEGALRNVAHTPDGRLLTAGNEGSFRVWDLADLQPVDLTQRLFEPSQRTAGSESFTQAVLAPEGRFVAAAGNTGRILVADLAAKNPAGACRVLEGHRGAVNSLVFASDGRLVSAGQDAIVRVWTAGPDGPTGPDRLLSEHKGPVHALALAPDRRLASGSEDGTVLVRDLNAGASDSATSMLPVGKPVWRLAFARDGRLAAASGDGTGRVVQVWDPQTQEPRPSSVRLLEGYQAITVLAFLPDDRLCIADLRGKVDFWGPRGTGPERAVAVTTGPNYAVLALPDGRVAIGGTGGVVLVLNLHDPEPLKTALTLRGHRSAVNALAWTSEGRMASGGRDGEVMLWNLDAPVGSQLVRVDSSGDVVHCLLSAPGDRIVAAGGNGKLKAWSTSVGRLLARAEAIVGRNLTKREWDLYFPGQPYRPTFKTLPEMP